MFNLRPSRYFHKTTNPKRYILIFAIGLLLFLDGCERKSAQLQALESLVSTIQPSTAHEISRWYADKGSGFTGPTYAEMRIEFEPTNHSTKEDVFNELVAILKNNDWEGEACSACSTASFSASLKQADYPIPIDARVRVHSDENLVTVRMVHSKP